MAMRFDPFRDLDRMTASLLMGGNALRLMPMDLYRAGNQYILSADLPGIDPSSVDIDVDGQLLTIRAERRLPTAENVQWLTREREAGSFLRQLNLGQGIDSSAITARYEHGVLEVTIPVSERPRSRRIEVTTTNDAQELSATPETTTNTSTDTNTDTSTDTSADTSADAGADAGAGGDGQVQESADSGPASTETATTN